MKITLELSPDQFAALADAVAERMGAVAPKPLTVAEFAKRVGEGRSTIQRKVQAGIIQKLPMPGGTRISAKELSRYVGATK